MVDFRREEGSSSGGQRALGVGAVIWPEGEIDLPTDDGTLPDNIGFDMDETHTLTHIHTSGICANECTSG